MKQFILVGLGGFFGSILRYGAGMWVSKIYPDFPSGTVLVNLVGSLLIGLLIGLSLKNSQSVFWFGVIGFCGGFTTFSTFSMDAVRMIRSDMWTPLLSYLGLSLIGGILLCMLGLWIGKMIVN